MNALAEIFAQFGINNLKTFLAFNLPKFLVDYNPFLNSIRNYYTEIFGFFQQQYENHEKTFDPNSMRDYLDVYMAERKRVNAAGEK